MRTVGLVRQTDELGRVVLPQDLRDAMGIKPKDAMEIFEDEDTIILRKYSPGCIFCDQVSNVVMFKGQKVCQRCIEEFANYK